MKLRVLPFALALFIGGCPKRQAPTRIVYLPASPPAATPAAAIRTQTIVIEEPAPPEPPPPPAEPTPARPQPVHRMRHRLRTEPPAESTENTPETTVPPPTPQVPSLEPRESSTEEASLRRQIQGLQSDVRQRIATLSRTRLAGADRKTLADARTFFAQSARALNEGDLQRALNLARKASLLVSALEP